MRITLTLDATDPERLAEFWAAALGYTALDEAGAFTALVPADERDPMLVIQRVGEQAPAGKNRMHLDVHVADVAAEVARLRALGASAVSADVRHEHGYEWQVLADPEGNELCVVKQPD
jgi:predicted enzyme related to lactoylglutathione lyase